MKERAEGDLMILEAVPCSILAGCGFGWLSNLFWWYNFGSCQTIREQFVSFFAIRSLCFEVDNLFIMIKSISIEC